MPTAREWIERELDQWRESLEADLNRQARLSEAGFILPNASDD